MTFPYKTLILVRFNVCVTPGTSSRSFFPRGRGGTKSQSKPPLPPPPNDHWDQLKTRFSYHRSKLAIFCVTEKGAQRDKPKPSARAQTFGPQHPCTKELSNLVGITAKPPVVGSRTKAKCAEYISSTSCAVTEAKGSLPATVLMVITQKAAPSSSSRAVILDALINTEKGTSVTREEVYQ